MFYISLTTVQVKLGTSADFNWINEAVTIKIDNSLHHHRYHLVAYPPLAKVRVAQWQRACKIKERQAGETCNHLWQRQKQLSFINLHKRPPLNSLCVLHEQTGTETIVHSNLHKCEENTREIHNVWVSVVTLKHTHIRGGPRSSHNSVFMT